MKEHKEIINKKEDFLLYDENKHLIGKRAKFKDNPTYINKCWGKKGIIMHHRGSKYISLKFDEPLKAGYCDSCITKTLFIAPNTIQLI